MADARTRCRSTREVRQWVYRAFWVVGLCLGAVQIYTVTVGDDAPDWVIGALAVLAYLSVATNYTADRNVTTKQEEPMAPLTPVPNAPETPAEIPEGPRGPVDEQVDESGVYDSPGILIAIACIVVIVCGIIWLVGR